MTREFVRDLLAAADIGTKQLHCDEFRVTSPNKVLQFLPNEHTRFRLDYRGIFYSIYFRVENKGSKKEMRFPFDRASNRNVTQRVISASTSAA